MPCLQPSRRRSRQFCGFLGLTLTAAVASCGVQIPDHGERPGAPAFARRADAALAANHNRLVDVPCPTGDRGSAPHSAQERTGDMNALAPPTWRSGDVGVTTQLSDGRDLWIFGDTVRARGSKPLVAPNSMLVSRGRCFSEVQTPTKGALIDSVGNHRVCWPNSAMTIPMGKRDLVLVGCSRIQRGQDGLYDFRYRGMTLAMFAVAKGSAPVLVRTAQVTSDNPDQEQINWGSAMVGHDGWIYIYGSQQPKGSSGKGAYVARTRLPNVTSHANWEFWNGYRFIDDVNDAAPFLPASEGVSQTYSVVPWKGRFLLVSKQGGEFGSHIGVWTAPRPEGPWSGYRAVPQPYSLGHGVVAYQPLAHPELATPSGNLLVSLSRNTEKFSDLVADPRKGRPTFIEVQAP